MEMKNWPFNEKGQIEDVEVARKMADVEKPFREAKTGFRRPKKEEMIKKGEKEAEMVYYFDKIYREKDAELEKDVSDIKMSEIERTDLQYNEIRINDKVLECKIKGADIKLILKSLSIIDSAQLKEAKIHKLRILESDDGSKKQFIYPSFSGVATKHEHSTVNGQLISGEDAKRIFNRYSKVFLKKIGSEVYTPLDYLEKIVQEKEKIEQEETQQGKVLVDNLLS